MQGYFAFLSWVVSCFGSNGRGSIEPSVSESCKERCLGRFQESFLCPSIGQPEIGLSLLDSRTGTPVTSPPGFLSLCTALDLGGGQKKALSVSHGNSLPFQKLCLSLKFTEFGVGIREINIFK